MDYSKQRILIVDDMETSVLLLMFEINRKYTDIKISTAQSIVTAKHKLSNEKFNLIISDNVFLLNEMEQPSFTKNQGLQFYIDLRRDNDQTPFVLYTQSKIEHLNYPAIETDENFYYLHKCRTKGLIELMADILH